MDMRKTPKVMQNNELTEKQNTRWVCLLFGDEYNTRPPWLQREVLYVCTMYSIPTIPTAIPSLEMGVLYVCTMYTGSVRGIYNRHGSWNPPYNLNPALYFGHYSRLIQNNAPILYTSAQKYMYRWRMIGLGWQIGIGTSCRSLIRGKGWEGKTNNQLESPLRFNGTHTYTQVPRTYTGCTEI